MLKQWPARFTYMCFKKLLVWFSNLEEEGDVKKIKFFFWVKIFALGFSFTKLVYISNLPLARWAKNKLKKKLFCIMFLKCQIKSSEKFSNFEMKWNQLIDDFSCLKIWRFIVRFGEISKFFLFPLKFSPCFPYLTYQIHIVIIQKPFFFFLGFIIK